MHTAVKWTDSFTSSTLTMSFSMEIPSVLHLTTNNGDQSATSTVYGSKTQAQSLLWSSVNDYYNLRLFSSKSDFANWSLKVYKKINKLKTISLTTTTRNSLKILQSSSDCETQPPTWGKRAFAQFKLDLQQVSQCHRKNALELASNRALFKSIRLAVCQNT